MTVCLRDNPISALFGTVLSCVFAGCCAALTCCASTADLKMDLQAPPWDQPQPLWKRLTYTIIVSNAGPDTATQVVVTNQVGEQFSDPVITVSQGVYTLTNRSLRCDLGELASGSAATVAIEVTPTNVAAIFLEAGVTSSNFDPTWPNTIYTLIQLGVVNLGVKIEVRTNRVFAGAPFAMTVTVTNLGPDPAEEVSLYSSVSSTQRCAFGECRYWPDFLGGTYSLTQGEVAEFHDSIPWHVRFGTIPPFGFATLDLTLVPVRTGELPFSCSASRTYSSTDGNISIPVIGGSGIIEFSVPKTNVWENAEAAVVEVRRHDGAEGAVEVSFSTHDDTAIAGQDYVAASGTLRFEPGETSKTIVVPLINNAQNECNRKFSLSLTQATDGAFLYGATNLSLVILDDDLAASGSLEPVAVSTNGLDTGNGDTAFSSLSADGRWLAFTSWADNLVPNDTNGHYADIFLKDLQTGEIRLLSQSRFGNYSGNRGSGLPLVTPDGRYVAFFSGATDLVTNIVPEGGQIYVRDIMAGVTRLVSVAPDGTGLDNGTSLTGFYTIMGISTNGQVVAFLNDGRKLANGLAQLFVRNLETETTVLVSVRYDGSGPGNGETREASLSADGRFIAFASQADDLLAGVTNPLWINQIYLRDLAEGRTVRVSDGDSPRITPDGRYLVFEGGGFSIYDLSKYDGTNYTSRAVSPGFVGRKDSPSLSADGRYVAFRGSPPNLPQQIYVYDSASDTLISANCRGTGLGNDHSFNPTISADGRYVFFQSFALDLAPGEFYEPPSPLESRVRNLYRRDLQESKTVLLSQNRALSGGGSLSSGLATQFAQSNITPDGNLAVVVSEDDLAYEDNNGGVDLYVWRAGGLRDNRPRLSISRESSELVLRWPSGATNFVLQSTSDLRGSGWTNLSAGTNTVVRVQPAGRAFFQLKQSP